MDTREHMGQAYCPRIVDTNIARLLTGVGAIILEGPRACGKTMTGLHHARSAYFLDTDGDSWLAAQAPEQMLAAEPPILLDEWQTAPSLWNLVRRHVDASAAPGQCILTGSAVPADDQTRHTGAGRFVRLRMRTMTWWERGDSRGTVSFAELCRGLSPVADMQMATYAEVIDALLRPGFPALTQAAPDIAHDVLRGYLDEVVRTDLGRLADLRHDPIVIMELLRSIARHTSQALKISTLTADVERVAPGISRRTVAKYVNELRRLFVVEEVPSWAPTLRSRARLRTSGTFHLADPALSAVLLDATTERLKGEPTARQRGDRLEAAGFLFESAVIHDLQVYAAAQRGQVQHYRDSNGHELDAVITLPGGDWIAVEVKLSGRKIPEARASLAAAVEQIDPAVHGAPLARLIITGTGPTLTLDDGTITVPLSALRE